MGIICSSRHSIGRILWQDNVFNLKKKVVGECRFCLALDCQCLNWGFHSLSILQVNDTCKLVLLFPHRFCSESYFYRTEHYFDSTRAFHINRKLFSSQGHWHVWHRIIIYHSVSVESLVLFGPTRSWIPWSFSPGVSFVQVLFSSRRSAVVPALCERPRGAAVK